MLGSASASFLACRFSGQIAKGLAAMWCASARSIKHLATWCQALRMFCNPHVLYAA